MGVPPRSRLLVALTLLTVVALPASAAYASAYSKVLGVYEQKGTVPPCQFTGAQLSSALKGIDTYGAQYFQDFTNAIQAALAARAGGACKPTHTAVVLGPSAGSGSASIPGGSVTRATGANLPAPIILMVVLAGALALVVAIVQLARWRGREPAWAQGWRHSWRESGYRTSLTWAEFVDWLRSSD
jgi:hypothetical protein